MASITGANENSMAVSLMAYANVQTALIGKVWVPHNLCDGGCFL